MTQKVSIVMPAKNEAAYLPVSVPALQRAIENHGAEGEIIVVDNGSSDGTPDLALLLGCRVIHVGTGSISRLRNEGARAAGGDFLGFVDADCVVSTVWLTHCMQRLEEEGTGMVGTRAVPDPARATWVEKGWLRLVSGAERPDYPAWIGTSNMLMAKEVFFRAGGFDESLATAEDVNLCRKVRLFSSIRLEKRVDTLHLRESKTVSELMRRERWRGRSSLREAFKSGELSREWQPIALYLVNLGSLAGTAASLAAAGTLWGALLFVNLSLPLAMIAKKKATLDSATAALQVYAVAYFYILARSLALLAELYEIAALPLERAKAASGLPPDAPTSKP